MKFAAHFVYGCGNHSKESCDQCSVLLHISGTLDKHKCNTAVVQGTQSTKFLLECSQRFTTGLVTCASSLQAP